MKVRLDKQKVFFDSMVLNMQEAAYVREPVFRGEVELLPDLELDAAIIDQDPNAWSFQRDSSDGRLKLWCDRILDGRRAMSASGTNGPAPTHL